MNDAAAPDRRVSGVSRVVLVDKPEGWTSYDVVRKIKGAYRGKIGHAGTLDPFATGLLVVLLGQATRLSSVFMDLPKEYAVTVQFGARSSTGDPTGEIEPSSGRVAAEAVVAALDGFRGEIVQRVPLTSAVKVDGERLYRKAHRGEQVETPERVVRVYDLTMVGFDQAAQRAELLAFTSKGTYVRRLAEDLGDAVGPGAYALTLRRLRVGPFAVGGAVEPAAVGAALGGAAGAGAALTLSEALAFLPAVTVGPEEACRVANGADIAADCPPGLFTVRSGEGLVALYEGVAGRGRARVVFPSVEE